MRTIKHASNYLFRKCGLFFQNKKKKIKMCFMQPFGSRNIHYYLYEIEMIPIADDKPFRRYVTAIAVTFFTSCIFAQEINIKTIIICRSECRTTMNCPCRTSSYGNKNIMWSTINEIMWIHSAENSFNFYQILFCRISST